MTPVNADSLKRVKAFNDLAAQQQKLEEMKKALDAEKDRLE